MEELSDQVSTDDRAIGGLKTKLEQMAQDEKLAELLFRRQALQAELKDLTKRWATLAVCHHLVNQTRVVYEKDRQPKVIQEAGRFTKIMTGMPYNLVMPVGKSDDIQVEDEILPLRIVPEHDHRLLLIRAEPEFKDEAFFVRNALPQKKADARHIRRLRHAKLRPPQWRTAMR